jgi:thioredoxin 1
MELNNIEDKLEVNANDWEKKILNSDTLTLVDFWHDRCPWCVRLNPILDEVAEEYKEKVNFFRLNVIKEAENRKIAMRYGVMGTPTLIFFCSGRSIGQEVGFITKDKLKEKLDDMLNNHPECLQQSTKLDFQK